MNPLHTNKPFDPVVHALRSRAALGWSLWLGLVFVFSASSTLADALSRSMKIRNFANQWLGTPYLWGGESRGGIDCSAFLRQMYRDVFHIELPRTTRQQIDLGVDLAINPTHPAEGLEPGDLFFYVDRTGTPNHVVVYMGGNQITHSTSGRGVVIEPIKKLWGRRVVARRFLLPASGGPNMGGGSGSGSGGGGNESLYGFAPIPPAGPMIAHEIPCPPSVRADRGEVRRYAIREIPNIRSFGERDICDFRALATALRHRGGVVAESNANKLEEHAEWLESIEALKGEIGQGW